jgi:imidazolonepropionase-like amidohydrolase
MKTAKGVTRIANGQLVDGNGGPALPDAAVVIRDGRIAYAGPVGGAPEVPPDATRIDARGGTILPGLVEAHFHPTYFDVAELADLDIKDMEGLILLINGPSEGRAAVRKLVKDGVEWTKTYPTGDAAAPDTADHHTLCMTLEEMAAVVAEAHNYRRKVTGHCRATEGIKNALRAGFDTLEHGTFLDDEALDMLLARDTPVVPALQFEWASIEYGPRFKMPQAVIDGHKETLEGGAERAADPQGRGPAWHGGRLRLRLEPPRRLRQGAQLLRQVCRVHAARSPPICHEDGCRDPGQRA